MIQTAINAMLGLGYLAGLVLVWIGLEMFVIDGGRLAPALFSVAAGIALWAALVAAGKALHRHAIRRMEAGR